MCDTSAGSKLNMAFINKWTERFKWNDEKWKKLPYKSSTTKPWLIKKEENYVIIYSCFKNDHLW